MCLNLKQIDKTNKTLLDLRARCLGDRIKLQEAKGNLETHLVKGQVRNVSGKYTLFFKGKDQIVFNLIYVVEKSSWKKTRAKKTNFKPHQKPKASMSC